MASSTSFDERKWVVQIRQNLEQVLDEQESIEAPVSIYCVPRTLLATDPDSYQPQQVSIGPYHCWRQGMYEMERYKLAATKRFQAHLESCNLEDVVLQLRNHEPQIRSCYHKYITCSGESLAWMMVLDACFMLLFLQTYAVKDGKQEQRDERISSGMSHLVDVKRRKAAHNATIRDLVMLENQIPLFVLRKLLQTRFSSPGMADRFLSQMLMGFLQAISPLKATEEFSVDQVMECQHLLDVLYKMIVQKPGKRCAPPRERKRGEADVEKGGEPQHRCCACGSVYCRKLLDEAWKILSRLNRGPVRVLKKIMSSKIFVFLKQLPWKIFSNLPGLKLLAGQLESMFKKPDGNGDPEDPSKDNSDDDKPPLVEEIKIPSVTQLSESYVTFSPTEDGIPGIAFDGKTLTLHLPQVSLDDNSSVLLKNLVAYEACQASGPVILARYTELMNGIIDSGDDARILREKKIILNRLKSDEEVAKLWNGMGRSVRLTKAPKMDKAIAEVNKFYSGRWRMKMRRFMKVYVFGSWQILSLLGCVAFLLLMILQAFCDVYSCPHIFHTEYLNSTP